MTGMSRSPGRDLVQRALEEARNAARRQGKDVGRGFSTPGARARRGSRRRWSGPGPDSRDPQVLGSAVRAVAHTRGWSSQVAEGNIFGRWRYVVGAAIADRTVPTALRDGVLFVSAQSTAWATQLRMAQAQIIAKINAAVGDGVVTSVRITGPSAPSWRGGPRHIAGRGPRDTYG